MSKALQKQLVASATGKHAEPSWNQLAPADKMELVRALNFYNANMDEKQKQKYAFAWIAKNRPDLLANAKRAPMYAFGTFAAMMRMESRGMILSEEHKAQMIAWAENLGPVKQDDEEGPKVAKPKKAKLNANMQALDDALDAAIKDPTVTFEVDVKSDTAPVIKYCQDQLDLISEDSEQYPKHMKKWFKAQIERLDGVKKAVKQKRVVTRKPRKIDPVKLTKGVKILEKDDSLKITSLKPAAIIGKKKAYVFDTKYRRLTKLVAAGESGFTFKGTSFLNIDLDKSVSKTLRKPGEVIKPNMGIRELDRAFGLVKGKENKVTGQRGSENLLIIQAS